MTDRQSEEEGEELAMVHRRINREGLELIKQWEGLRLEAYLCPARVWTVGYGHTRSARMGLQITKEEAESLLREDLRVFEKGVERLIDVRLSDGQFAALVSFAFNVGLGAFERSTLRRRLNERRYEDVPAQLMRWVKAGGRRLQGLVNRRSAEAGLWARGSFVSGSIEAVDEPEDAA